MKVQSLNSANYNQYKRPINPQFYGGTNRLCSIKQNAIDLATRTASALGLSYLITFPMKEASDATRENLKNKSQILESFKKRLNIYFENDIEPFETIIKDSLDGFGKFHTFLILECMKHEDFSIMMTLHDIIAGYQVFHNPRVFNHVTNLIQNHPDFPPELIRSALFKCDTLQLKNYNELYQKMDEEYKFNQGTTQITLDLKNQVLNNPDLYVNGDLNNEAKNKEKILSLFNNHFHSISELIEILGKEAVDVILRKRIVNASDFFFIWSQLNMDAANCYKKLIKCNDPKGKPLSTNSKLELVNLLFVYKNCTLPLNNFEKCITENKINMKNLELDVLKKIMIKAGISPKFINVLPEKNFENWDLENIHNLAISVEDNPYKFARLLKIIHFYNFKTYIHLTKNSFGKTNAITAKMFKDAKLNYNKWLNPDKELNKNFKVTDNNSLQLKYIAQKINEEMETLSKNPDMKKIIERRFPYCIKDEKFLIPEKIYHSKTNLENFLKNIDHQFQDVWARAESNTHSPQKTKAIEVLTIKDHLKSYQSSLKTLPQDFKSVKSIDWTIKMWDRYPKKDLFQGNYSNCCIAMGRVNGHYMLDYLANTLFNMIEIVDNTNGKTLGNALCYFVKDPKDNLAFVVDNIEIDPAKTLTPENGIKLRECIADYIQEVISTLGRKNIPIYIGKSFNDLPVEDLPKAESFFSLLGKLECEEIYLDFFRRQDDGIAYDWDLEHRNCKFLKLRDLN